MKLIVGELMVDSGRLWRSTSFAARLRGRWGSAWRAASSIAAQEPDAPAQTNDASAAEVLSQLNDLVQAADSTQPEDMAPPDDLTATNGLPQANGPAPSGDRTDRVNRFDNSQPISE